MNKSAMRIFVMALTGKIIALNINPRSTEDSILAKVDAMQQPRCGTRRTLRTRCVQELHRVDAMSVACAARALIKLKKATMGPRSVPPRKR